MFDDLRADLVRELLNEVPPKRMAQKISQLLDAEDVIMDSLGRPIHVPDNATQYKTLELVSKIRGDFAPTKSLTVNAKPQDFQPKFPEQEKMQALAKARLEDEQQNQT